MLQQLHALSRAAQRPRTVSAAAWSAAAAVSAAAWSAQLARPSPLAWSPNITASCKRNASGHNHMCPTRACADHSDPDDLDMQERLAGSRYDAGRPAQVSPLP